MAKTEIEGKWINLGGFFNPELARERVLIQQGYVAIDPNGPAVRVRRMVVHGAEKFTLAAKGKPITPGEKIEAEDDISASLFGKLWELTAGRRVEKIRHIMPEISVMLLGETVRLTPEVDVFTGSLDKLVMMDIEVTTTAQLQELREYGEWAFGTDVTDDEAYSNANLAIKGIPPVTNKLF